VKGGFLGVREWSDSIVIKRISMIGLCLTEVCIVTAQTDEYGLRGEDKERDHDREDNANLCAVKIETHVSYR